MVYNFDWLCTHQQRNTRSSPEVTGQGAIQVCWGITSCARKALVGIELQQAKYLLWYFLSIWLLP